MSAAGTPPFRPQLAPLMMAQQLQMPLPTIVFNGFSHTHTASEVSGLLTFGDRPIATLVMAPVIAKSFALSLLETVQHYERSTGTVVSTLDELSERMAKFTANEAP
jgi:hypothetical protein